MNNIDYSPIGGYFELELNNFKSIYHNSAIAVNSARNALEYILLVNNYKKLYLPYYTCDVTLQPLKKLDLEFEFYHINDDFLPIIDKVNNDEVVLFVNYFGIMDNMVNELKIKYKNLIVDNAQAFYAKPLIDVSTIYSPRKFFGIPDGGFVYTISDKLLKLDNDKSDDRITHLIARAENEVEKGYELFKENDLKLDYLPLRKMSILTKKLLENINFEYILHKRNFNFSILHKSLKNSNLLTPIIEEQNINGPMVYPYLKEGNNDLIAKLVKNKIFVAKYWPNVVDWLNNKKCYELFLYNNLAAIPVDQRYGKKEMELILNLIY